jgi:hypothetical protein
MPERNLSRALKTAYPARFAHDILAADLSATQEASFWSMVELQFVSECWHWTGAIENGYGRFKIGGRRRCSAHRVAYALAFGRCPANLVVRHACDNSVCVAPHHLVLGTDTENIQDRCARGRTPMGEAHARAILTDEQVRAIREDGRIARVIAAEFGVHKSTVAKIKTRRIWKHLE